MKKYTMLGVNKDKCCTLSCLLSFDNLMQDEIEADDFNHGCFGWCGCGEIESTLNHIGMKQTGRVIVLDAPIVFYGQDYDWGHSYEWLFEVKEIHELESKE